MLVRLALNVLRWFFEVGASRLAIRDQPPPSKPVIPEALIIPRWLELFYYAIE